MICPESYCESPRKYLLKDLDGTALGLPPPVSVFPKIEAEWTGSFFNTGQLYPHMPTVETMCVKELVWLSCLMGIKYTGWELSSRVGVPANML